MKCSLPSTTYHLPHIKGALYVEGSGEEGCEITDTSEACGEQYLNIDNTDFIANEAGYSYRFDSSQPEASALYIKDVRNVNLNVVSFKEHNKTSFVELMTSKVAAYMDSFPELYFNHSHSPIVRISHQDLTGFSTSENHLQYITELNGVFFDANSNFQLLGLGEQAYYHGSLIHYEA